MNQEEREERREAIRDVKLYMANDWEIKEETPEYFLLSKNSATGWGHFWVFLFTVSWTFGLGNLIYHFAKNKTKKVIK